MRERDRRTVLRTVSFTVFHLAVECMLFPEMFVLSPPPAGLFFLLVLDLV
jgi:hypothetical protein